VVAIATRGRSPPQAIPTAAVTHTPAAVVRPRTVSRRAKMMPPPMNPIPETICAATRDGSSELFGSAIPSANPKTLTSMNTAEPTPTSE
jgi:hypothetical protein